MTEEVSECILFLLDHFGCVSWPEDYSMNLAEQLEDVDFKIQPVISASWSESSCKKLNMTLKQSVDRNEIANVKEHLLSTYKTRNPEKGMKVLLAVIDDGRDVGTSTTEGRIPFDAKGYIKNVSIMRHFLKDVVEAPSPMDDLDDEEEQDMRQFLSSTSALSRCYPLHGCSFREADKLAENMLGHHGSSCDSVLRPEISLILRNLREYEAFVTGRPGQDRQPFLLSSDMSCKNVYWKAAHEAAKNIITKAMQVFQMDLTSLYNANPNILSQNEDKEVKDSILKKIVEDMKDLKLACKSIIVERFFSVVFQALKQAAEGSGRTEFERRTERTFRTIFTQERGYLNMRLQNKTAETNDGMYLQMIGGAEDAYKALLPAFDVKPNVTAHNKKHAVHAIYSALKAHVATKKDDLTKNVSYKIDHSLKLDGENVETQSIFDAKTKILDATRKHFCQKLDLQWFIHLNPTTENEWPGLLSRGMVKNYGYNVLQFFQHAAGFRFFILDQDISLTKYLGEGKNLTPVLMDALGNSHAACNPSIKAADDEDDAAKKVDLWKTYKPEEIPSGGDQKYTVYLRTGLKRIDECFDDMKKELVQRQNNLKELSIDQHPDVQQQQREADQIANYRLYLLIFIHDVFKRTMQQCISDLDSCVQRIDTVLYMSTLIMNHQASEYSWYVEMMRGMEGDDSSPVSRVLTAARYLLTMQKNGVSVYSDQYLRERIRRSRVFNPLATAIWRMHDLDELPEFNALKRWHVPGARVSKDTDQNSDDNESEPTEDYADLTRDRLKKHVIDDFVVEDKWTDSSDNEEQSVDGDTEGSASNEDGEDADPASTDQSDTEGSASNESGEDADPASTDQSDSGAGQDSSTGQEVAEPDSVQKIQEDLDKLETNRPECSHYLQKWDFMTAYTSAAEAESKFKEFKTGPETVYTFEKLGSLNTHLHGSLPSQVNKQADKSMIEDAKEKFKIRLHGSKRDSHDLNESELNMANFLLTKEDEGSYESISSDAVAWALFTMRKNGTNERYHKTIQNLINMGVETFASIKIVQSMQMYMQPADIDFVMGNVFKHLVPGATDDVKDAATAGSDGGSTDAMEVSASDDKAAAADAMEVSSSDDKAAAAGAKEGSGVQDGTKSGEREVVMHTASIIPYSQWVPKERAKILKIYKIFLDDCKKGRNDFKKHAKSLNALSARVKSIGLTGLENISNQIEQSLQFNTSQLDLLNTRAVEAGLKKESKMYKKCLEFDTNKDVYEEALPKKIERDLLRIYKDWKHHAIEMKKFFLQHRAADGLRAIGNEFNHAYGEFNNFMGMFQKESYDQYMKLLHDGMLIEEDEENKKALQKEIDEASAIRQKIDVLWLDGTLLIECGERIEERVCEEVEKRLIREMQIKAGVDLLARHVPFLKEWNTGIENMPEFSPQTVRKSAQLPEDFQRELRFFIRSSEGHGLSYKDIVMNIVQALQNLILSGFADADLNWKAVKGRERSDKSDYNDRKSLPSGLFSFVPNNSMRKTLTGSNLVNATILLCLDLALGLAGRLSKQRDENMKKNPKDRDNDDEILRTLQKVENFSKDKQSPFWKSVYNEIMFSFQIGQESAEMDKIQENVLVFKKLFDTLYISNNSGEDEDEIVSNRESMKRLEFFMSKVQESKDCADKVLISSMKMGKVLAGGEAVMYNGAFVDEQDDLDAILQSVQDWSTTKKEKMAVSQATRSKPFKDSKNVSLRSRASLLQMISDYFVKSGKSEEIAKEDFNAFCTVIREYQEEDQSQLPPAETDTNSLPPAETDADPFQERLNNIRQALRDLGGLEGYQTFYELNENLHDLLNHIQSFNSRKGLTPSERKSLKSLENQYDKVSEEIKNMYISLSGLSGPKRGISAEEIMNSLSQEYADAMHVLMDGRFTLLEHSTEEDDYIIYMQKWLSARRDAERDILAELTYYVDRLRDIQDDIDIYDEVLEDMWNSEGVPGSEDGGGAAAAPHPVSRERLKLYFEKNLANIDMAKSTDRLLEKQRVVQKMLDQYERLDGDLQRAGLLDPELLRQNNVKMLTKKLQEMGVQEKLSNLSCTEEEKQGMQAILNAIMRSQGDSAAQAVGIDLNTELKQEHLQLLNKFVQRALYDELLDKNGKVDPSHPSIALPSILKVRMEMLDELNSGVQSARTLLEKFRSKRKSFE